MKWSPAKQFEEIKKIENQHPYLKGKTIQGVADPAIWQADSGESVAQVAAKYGIFFSKGDNQRVAGWMQMHYRMSFSEDGEPMMYIFNNCKAFIRTIPLLMYDATHVEDLDSSGEDHCADEARYFCMSRPIAPRLAERKIAQGDDPLNQRVKKRRNIYVRP